LAHAAIAPVCLPVLEAVKHTLEYSARWGQGAFEYAAELRQHLREKLGKLLGVQPNSLALTSGTSRGLTDLALSIPWRPGQTILLFDGEFPANVTPWQQAARVFQLQLCFQSLAGAYRDTDLILGPLERRLRQGVRLVAVSAVQFQTGLRMPLQAMTQLCHRYGAQIAVDAIQAAGIVPLDVQALELDYLVGGAHKWLMGIEGAGYIYVHPDNIGTLEPLTAGWLSHEDSLRFLIEGSGYLDYRLPFKKSAQVFEGSSSSVASAAALEASVGILAELGVSSIFEHVSEYLDALQRGLTDRGITHYRSDSAELRSGILSFEVPDARPLPAMAALLRQRGIYVSTPDGLLRLAPHFPNRLDEVPEVLASLDECLEQSLG
jgi:selenocysteine lyase/cysteine desulfurase